MKPADRLLFMASGVGLLFGVGLGLSDMINPARVLGFLDLFNGRWDPTLAFVMGGALLVTVPGFALARRRGAPVFAHDFFNPTATRIDRPLVLGAVLFGIGWGIGGLCPGPAIANLGQVQAEPLLFVGSMLAGMYLFKLLKH